MTTKKAKTTKKPRGVTLKELMSWLEGIPDDAVVTFGAINNPTQRLTWKYYLLDPTEPVTYDEASKTITLWPGEGDSP